MNHTKLQVPLVHRNGTSATALLEQWQNVLDAVDAAVTALRDATPHARDYYPLENNNAYTDARDEHRYRLGALCKVRDEVEYLMTQVQEQVNDARERADTWERLDSNRV